MVDKYQQIGRKFHRMLTSETDISAIIIIPLQWKYENLLCMINNSIKYNREHKTCNRSLVKVNAL